MGGALDTLLGSAPNAIAVLDRDMRYLAYSQRWLEAYRLPQGDLLGRSHYDVFPEIGEEWKRIHRECLAGAVRSREDDAFPRADGGIDYVSWWLGPWYEADGAIGGLVMQTTVRSTQMIVEREMSLLLESTRTIPWRLDVASQEFTFMGQQMEALLGYPLDSWVGVQSWLERVHADDREKAREYAERVLEDNFDQEMEYRLISASGECIWIRDVMAPVYDERGSLIAVTGLCIDISEKKATEESLRLREQQYREVIETSGDGFWLVDAQGTLLDTNEAYARLSGYSKEELVGMHISDLEAMEKPEETKAHIEEVIRVGHALFETRHRRKDGSEWDVEISTSFSHASGGLFSVFARDISERKAMLARLNLIGEVFNNTGEGIVITDADGIVVDVNNAYCKIMGYRREQMLGQNPSMVSSGRHDKAFYEEMWRSIKEEGHWIGEVWDRRANGEIFPKWLSINTVYDEGGAVSHYVGTFSDISALKDVEEQLQKLAYYDALTGLPNRILFRDRLEQELSICRRLESKCAVMFLDLDRFKFVNDSLGHAAGDELLIEVARRISENVRENDTVARLGGDEFTLILREIGNIDAVALVAMKVIEDLGQPFTLQGSEVHIGASIGITIFPSDGADFETLTMRADAAMYEAKEAGRGQYHFYTGYMDDNAHQHMRLESDLHRVLERDELRLHFQPQVNASDGSLAGVEALLRWQHPEFGLLGPERFISLAEENGVIIPMGDWVLRKVCAYLSQWREQGLRPPPVAINLSARQFRQTGLVHDIIKVVEAYAIAPEMLELEITESVAMENASAVAERLQLLSRKGFSIAIDDFGTGYSSLSYLKRFPANKIKLDRSFVAGIPESADSMAVASAVINMAKSLGYQLVAEGVENERQRAFLRDGGADVMQGFLFSRPLDPEAFEAHLRAHPTT